jgi:alkanesulfonate monooxygenase
MTLTFDWFLPTSGDGRTIMGRGHSLPLARRTGHGAGLARAVDAERPPDLEYLAQVARSAEQLGFEAVLTPTSTWCEDAWLATAALIGQTSRLKFLVAFRPGLISPTLAAQMAATYQRLSRGRLLLNVVTGSQADEQRRFGDHLSHDERYGRTAEFLAIVRGAWSGAPFDFSGQHYQVTGATVMRPPDPVPGVYFGGSSAAAGPVAARYADTYLTWGEPPAQVAEKLAWIRGLASAEDRKLRFGIRLHVITRDTEQEAWDVASALLDHIDPAEIEYAQQILGATESTGQDRMLALHASYRRGGPASDLEVYPHLWAGVGLVRGGAGTALVGSHEQVADLIEEYASLGISEFILSGYPHLEEAYWFGEGVLPELRRRGVWAPPWALGSWTAPDPAGARELEGSGYGLRLTVGRTGCGPASLLVMPVDFAAFAAVLRDLGVAGQVRELPEPAPTAATAAAQLGCEVGAIANSLIFSADGAPLLVMTSGAHRVDTARVAALVGVSAVQRADARSVREWTGQAIGGVAPVGHPAPIRTLVDTWLDKYDVVWAAAGHPHTVFPTSFAELIRITGGTPADVGA